MKKKLLWIALILTGLLVFAGCKALTESAEDQVAEATEKIKEEVEKTTDKIIEEVESVTQGETEAELVTKPVLKVATLKGPTGMGMVGLMENDAKGISAVDYVFEVVGAPDQLVGQTVQGKVDIAAVPSNLGVILNIKTEGNIQLLAVNTLGVLYIVENGNSIQSLADLEGKTIIASGKGASPEYALNYILAENGLTDKVTVDYLTEHAEVAAKVKAEEGVIGLLPQPFVTSTLLSSETSRIALDLNKEWEKVTKGSILTMGAVVVNKAFAKENPEVIATFMEEYKKSVDFVNEEAKIAGELIEKFGILPKAALATKAIPDCNITLIEAQEAKESLMTYYKILHSFNPKSVGGKLPEDDFFYE